MGSFIVAALAIFAYMSFHIGAFRFDSIAYMRYHALFTDVSGLSRKAALKISGVTVGWVEDVTLTRQGPSQAHVTLAVHHEHVIYSNARAAIRQDGLLGSKYVEIVPGDSTTPPLEPGGTITTAEGAASTSIDELLASCRRITGAVEEVVAELKKTINRPETAENIRDLVEGLRSAVAGLSSLGFVCQKLEKETLVSVQANLEKLARILDKDVGRLTAKFESGTDEVEHTLREARQGLKTLGSIAEKVDKGAGLAGKLVNEDGVYHDLKAATQKLRTCFDSVGSLQLVFDAHFEAMCLRNTSYPHKDSKGYFDLRVHPSDDYFFLVELATSQRGIIFRDDISCSFSGLGNDCCVDAEKLNLDDEARLRFQCVRHRQKFKRNTMHVGVQFGKIFGDAAVRLGLFDGYFAGVGLDVDLPLTAERLRWLTTFEVYDFRGLNKERDCRPHLKWLNRIYGFHNLYFVFGADDFASHHNANVFIGAGIRFGGEGARCLVPCV